MPRSKTNLLKLPKALREPIEDGLPPLFLSDDETKAWVVQNAGRLFSESLAKLYLLMDELGIPAELKDAARWLLLSLTLARKLYPGFQTTLEARPKGRPRRGQSKAHGQRDLRRFAEARDRHARSRPQIKQPVKCSSSAKIAPCGRRRAERSSRAKRGRFRRSSRRCAKAPSARRMAS